jgi:hypothetical protein
VLRRAASAIKKKIKAIAGVKPAAGKAVSGRKVLTGLMRPWCTASQPNTLGASVAWKTAALGNPGWPVAGNDTTFCDWAEKTTTDVSFKVCTFPRDLDTQVSAYIHKEGHWSGWKKGLVQEMLPVLRSGAAWKGVEGRTLVLDVSGGGGGDYAGGFLLLFLGLVVTVCFAPHICLHLKHTHTHTHAHVSFPPQSL